MSALTAPGGHMAGSRTLRNFINGASVDAADGGSLDLVDPATGSVFATSPRSGAADVDAAMTAAAAAFESWRGNTPSEPPGAAFGLPRREGAPGAADVDAAMTAAAAAFESWRDTTPSERQRALLRIADAMESRAKEIVDAECETTGKPVQLTLDEELPPTLDQIRFFAGAARVLEGRSAGEYRAGHTSMIRREPIGVCAQVTPWNYPMMMAVWKFAPAIAAGNTVVLNPSDTTPATTSLMAEIAAEFLPPGVLNVVCGDRDTGRLLVAHKVPQMVSVTGSIRAGMEVATSAATDLKRVHLELGGKAPVVVFDDADVAAAAEGIAMAGYFNAGQDCTAATRVLAGPRVHDDFLSALV